MHIRTQLIAHMQALDIFHGAPETQPSLLFIYTCIATHMYVYIYTYIYKHIAIDRAFNLISCGGLRCAQTRPINSAQDYVRTYAGRVRLKSHPTTCLTYVPNVQDKSTHILR